MPRATRVLLALAAALSRPALADASEAGSDATCSAQSTSPECVGPAVVERSLAPAPKPPQVMMDLITQEVQELEQYIALCEARIGMLQDLQGVVESGFNLSLPTAHARALKEKLPLLSEVPLDAETAPLGSADDYTLTKAVLPMEEPIAFVKFMPLKAPASASSNTGTTPPFPLALLVAAQLDGTVRLFTPAGELMLSYNAGHEHPLVQLAVSPREDESMVVTGDAGGVMRVYKVRVQPRKPTSDEKKARKGTPLERVSSYLGPQLNVTAQLHRQLGAPQSSDGETTRITSLALASTQGQKYFVAGDAEGTISIFTKNGTLKTKLDAATTPGTGIEGLHPLSKDLLFRAGTEWGFVDLEKMEVRRVDCPGFEGRVAAVTVDAQQTSRILVADEAGTIWVFSMKNKQKECKVDHKFAKGASKGIVDLVSVRGFAIGLESPGPDAAEAPWSIVALNMSHVGRRKWEVLSPVVWRRYRTPVRSWSLFKRTQQQGDLFAFLSDDGKEIEIVEVMMSVYTPPVEDNFGNFKFPVIAVAVVLVLGYQYMKQKNKFGAAAPAAKPAKRDWEKDLAELRRKRAASKAVAGKA